MVMSTAGFVSDLYFFINHDKNLINLQSSGGGITFVHFLTVMYNHVASAYMYKCVCMYVRAQTNLAGFECSFERTNEHSNVD